MDPYTLKARPGALKRLYSMQAQFQNGGALAQCPFAAHVRPVPQLAPLFFPRHADAPHPHICNGSVAGTRAGESVADAVSSGATPEHASGETEVLGPLGSAATAEPANNPAPTSMTATTSTRLRTM
jgi:hypothetical protein